jgi:hypothetical protein
MFSNNKKNIHQFPYLFIFLNYSIFNNSHIVGPNIMKPPQHTPIHWRFSNHTKDTMGTTMVESFQCNKQRNDSLK